MDKHDFREWYSDFRVRFPSKAAWLEKHDGTLASWMGIFRDIRLGDCLKANIACQRTGSITDAWDDIPRIVAREAKMIAANRLMEQHRPQESFPTCEHCDNTGTVTCWSNPLVVRKIDRGEPYRCGYQVWIPCCCPRGQRVLWVKRRGEWEKEQITTQYDPRQYCRVQSRDPRADVVPWLEARLLRKQNT